MVNNGVIVHRTYNGLRVLESGVLIARRLTLRWRHHFSSELPGLELQIWVNERARYEFKRNLTWMLPPPVPLPMFASLILPAYPTFLLLVSAQRSVLGLLLQLLHH